MKSKDEIPLDADPLVIIRCLTCVNCGYYGPDEDATIYKNTERLHPRPYCNSDGCCYRLNKDRLAGLVPMLQSATGRDGMREKMMKNIFWDLFDDRMQDHDVFPKPWDEFPWERDREPVKLLRDYVEVKIVENAKVSMDDLESYAIWGIQEASWYLFDTDGNIDVKWRKSIHRIETSDGMYIIGDAECVIYYGKPSHVAVALYELQRHDHSLKGYALPVNPFSTREMNWKWVSTFVKEKNRAYWDLCTRSTGDDFP